jgi:hypothetical protein
MILDMNEVVHPLFPPLFPDNHVGLKDKVAAFRDAHAWDESLDFSLPVQETDYRCLVCNPVSWGTSRCRSRRRKVTPSPIDTAEEQ